jgi:hypothetical protein
MSNDKYFGRTSKQWIDSWLSYRTKRDRGEYWLGQIQEYIPYQKFIDLVWIGLAAKIGVSGASAHFIIVSALIFLAYKLFMELMRWIIATLDYKYGIWLREIDWGAKNTKYNIYQIQMMRTVQEIAKKVDAKSHFTELEEDCNYLSLMKKK